MHSACLGYTRHGGPVYAENESGEREWGECVTGQEDAAGPLGGSPETGWFILRSSVSLLL